MEQIYTIPVNESFEKAHGCPFCRLERDLTKNEIDTILGASMMEPDIRKKTNEQGFCKEHFGEMMKAGKRLPLALILESHLSEVKKAVKKPLVVSNVTCGANAKKIGEISDDCYVCRRVELYLSKMFENAAELFRADPDFKDKIARQEYLCLPHYTRFILSGKAQLDKKTFAEFYKVVYAVEDKKLSDVSEKVTYFTKKFDYRYQNEPWNGAENAPDDAIDFLVGDGGED